MRGKLGPLYKNNLEICLVLFINISLGICGLHLASSACYCKALQKKRDLLSFLIYIRDHQNVIPSIHRSPSVSETGIQGCVSLCSRARCRDSSVNID